MLINHILYIFVLFTILYFFIKKYSDFDNFVNFLIFVIIGFILNYFILGFIKELFPFITYQIKIYIVLLKNLLFYSIIPITLSIITIKLLIKTFQKIQISEDFISYLILFLGFFAGWFLSEFFYEMSKNEIRINPFYYVHKILLIYSISILSAYSYYNFSNEYQTINKIFYGTLFIIPLIIYCLFETLAFYNNPLFHISIPINLFIIYIFYKNQLK